MDQIITKDENDKNNLLKKIKNIPNNFKLFIKYPFFENDVETLKEQNYLL